MVICAVFVLLATAAPVIAPYDPLATDWGALRQAPSETYWFGTDDIGRDVLSRVIWGSRASLMAGVVSVLIAMAVGVPLGTVSGYAGGADRHRADAHHRRAARRARADPGDRACRLPRPEPDQCNDRDRHRGGSGVHAADARADAGDAASGVCRGGAQHGLHQSAHHRSPHSAEHHAGAAGAGDAEHRHRHHRRSRPVISGSRPATAGAKLGRFAERRAQLHRRRALDVDLARRVHLPRRVRLQPARRRPPRRARPDAICEGTACRWTMPRSPPDPTSSAALASWPPPIGSRHRRACACSNSAATHSTPRWPRRSRCTS